MQLIDIGANLTHESFEPDLDEVLERAKQESVQQMIVTGASPQGSLDAIKLAENYPQLFATVGVHPHEAELWNDDIDKQHRELCKHEQVVAVGECGLDYFRDFSPRDKQRYDVVVHCFTGEEHEMQAYLKLNCYIGITGWICDERRGHHLREFINQIPADRLLIETDAPYLLPRDIRPKPKTRRNEPMWLKHIAEVIAECLGKPVEQLANEIFENSQRFFKLK